MLPNNTFNKTVYNPWYNEAWDTGDTLLLDPRTDKDIATHTKKYFEAHPDFDTWYQQKINGTIDEEKEAAQRSRTFTDTPTKTYFDVLGRGFLSVARHKVLCPGHELNGKVELLYSRVETDIQGYRIIVRDSVISAGDKMGRILEKAQFDMQGNPMHVWSAEKGETWVLKSVIGSPLKVWDSKNQFVRSEYDTAGRPLRTFLKRLDTGEPEKLVSRLVYGEAHPESEQKNLRGAVYLSLDQSGRALIDGNDFKGNPT